MARRYNSKTAFSASVRMTTDGVAHDVRHAVLRLGDLPTPGRWPTSCSTTSRSRPPAPCHQPELALALSQPRRDLIGAGIEIRRRRSTRSRCPPYGHPVAEGVDVLCQLTLSWSKEGLFSRHSHQVFDLANRDRVHPLAHRDDPTSTQAERRGLERPLGLALWLELYESETVLGWAGWFRRAGWGCCRCRPCLVSCSGSRPGPAASLPPPRVRNRMGPSPGR